ncbi:MAG TPA: SMR family transporter [Bryobacteraceae bacterium]
MVKLLLLLAASIAYTIGGVCMKYSQGLTRALPSILLFALFIAGAAFQAIAIEKSEMAVIFVLGLESVLAFLLGVIVFRESASLGRMAAVGLVTAGIILLHR